MNLGLEVERCVVTPDPHVATATVRPEASDDLHSAVLGWLDSECVGTWRFTTSARVLRREFCAWSGVACSEAEFAAALGTRGFVAERGLVEGLALAEDFLIAVEYEREDLRFERATQLDLFGMKQG